MFRRGQGCRGGGLREADPPFLKLSKILGRLIPYIEHVLGWISSELCAFDKGGERKGTLLTIEENCFNPILAFSFYLYFQIRSNNKNISFINAKMGVVHIFPTTQCPLVTVLERHHWSRGHYP